MAKRVPSLSYPPKSNLTFLHYVLGLAKCGLFYPAIILKSITLSVEDLLLLSGPETWVWSTDNSDKSDKLLLTEGGSTQIARRNIFFSLGCFIFSVFQFPIYQTGRLPGEHMVGDGAKKDCLLMAGFCLVELVIKVNWRWVIMQQQVCFSALNSQKT